MRVIPPETIAVVLTMEELQIIRAAIISGVDKDMPVVKDLLRDVTSVLAIR